MLNTVRGLVNVEEDKRHNNVDSHLVEKCNLCREKSNCEIGLKELFLHFSRL